MGLEGKEREGGIVRDELRMRLGERRGEKLPNATIYQPLIERFITT